MSKLPLRFEYWKSNKNRQWYWRLKAGNNEPLCQSEGYKSKESVVKAYHAIFDFESTPVMVDINAEAYAKFKKAVEAEKPKRVCDSINRNWP
jgi:uncharacterized protein YegP (UPF0339 family)